MIIIMLFYKIISVTATLLLWIMLTEFLRGPFSCLLSHHLWLHLMQFSWWQEKYQKIFCSVCDLSWTSST